MTQLQMINRAHRFTGLPLYEVVNMASLYPARIINVDDRKGSLEEGKDADVLICNHDLDLKSVILQGKQISITV